MELLRQMDPLGTGNNTDYSAEFTETKDQTMCDMLMDMTNYVSMDLRSMSCAA